MINNSSATLWHVAWVLVALVTVGIAFDVSVIAAVGFWLAFTLILLALRPQ